MKTVCKTALCLAVLLLVLCGTACGKENQKKPYDPNAEYVLSELYLNETIGEVERFEKADAENGQGSEPEKTVKVGNNEYRLTLVAAEQTRAASGKVLATANKYYKAAVKDGSSPKLTAVFDRDGDLMNELTVEGIDPASIMSEEDLKSLFLDTLKDNCGYTPSGQLNIFSGVDGTTTTGYGEGASAYIVSANETFSGFHCVSATMLVHDSTMFISFSRGDTERYAKLLRSMGAGVLEQKTAAYINERLEKGASKGTVTIAENTVIFASEGGRGCFRFDGTFKAGDKEQAFSALYFVDVEK